MAYCFIIEEYNPNGEIIARRVLYDVKSKNKEFVMSEQSKPLPFWGMELWNYFEDDGFINFMFPKKNITKNPTGFLQSFAYGKYVLDSKTVKMVSL
jgi:hypothetical protein